MRLRRSKKLGPSALARSHPSKHAPPSRARAPSSIPAASIRHSSPLAIPSAATHTKANCYAALPALVPPGGLGQPRAAARGPQGVLGFFDWRPAIDGSGCLSLGGAESLLNERRARAMELPCPPKTHFLPKNATQACRVVVARAATEEKVELATTNGVSASAPTNMMDFEELSDIIRCVCASCWATPASPEPPPQRWRWLIDAFFARIDRLERDREAWRAAGGARAQSRLSPPKRC